MGRSTCNPKCLIGRLTGGQLGVFYFRTVLSDDVLLYVYRINMPPVRWENKNIYTQFSGTFDDTPSERGVCHDIQGRRTRAPRPRWAEHVAD